MKEAESNVRLIDLEKVETSDIWAILSSYYVEGLLGQDEDMVGDIVIQRSQRFYIKVDHRYKMLRLFSFMTTTVSLDNPEFLKILEDSNSASSSVKYSLLSNSVMAEYGIPLFGFIDHKHLLKVVEHFARKFKDLKVVLSDFVEV